MIKKPWQIWSLFGLILLIVLPAMVWLTMQINEADRLREDDRAETELARRKAELQERINSALYRLDSWTTPLVAREAARPYYLYQSFFDVAASDGFEQALGLPQPRPQAQGWRPRQTVQQTSRPPQLQAPNSPFRMQQQANLPAQMRQEASPASTYTRRPSPLLFGTSEYVVMHFQISSDDQVTSPQRPMGEVQTTAMITCNIPENQILDNDTNLKLAEQFCNYQAIAFKCPTLPPTNWGVDGQPPELATAADDPPFQMVYSDPNFERFTNGWGETNLQPPQLPPSKDQVSSWVKGGKPQLGKGSKSQQQAGRNNDRGNREYNERAKNSVASVNQAYRDQQQLYNNNFPDRPNLPENAFSPNEQTAATRSDFVREGVMRPIWLDGRLLLARRVEGEDKKLVQCCWLDWEQIQTELKEEIADLLPECELEPVQDKQDLQLSRAMATLPVQLVVNSDKLLSTLALSSNPQITAAPSALKLSLTIAWLGLGMAAVASALLLRGVLKLSERRAAFVSAVTHELRTPLTTFRMYSEMLAEEMVPEGKRGEYAETMKHEADRLSNLVENVLQFAKLERGVGVSRTESINILDLIGRFEDRMEHRANTMGMDFSIDLGQSASTMISTDPGKIELIVFNLVDNACKYASQGDNKQIELVVEQTAGTIAISVRDYGPGVTGKFRKLLFKPFCKSDQDAADTASGVGLGLALCQQMAKSIGGRVSFVDCNQGAKFILTIPA